MEDKIFYKKTNKGKIFCILTVPKKNNKKIVIIAHGFRSSCTGSARELVMIARKFAEKGITSLRFDQIGSGNSDGNFYDSSFNGWIETIQKLSLLYINKGYRVALMGSSMGAAAVVDSLENQTIRKNIRGLALWVPDPKIDTRTYHAKYMEEGGQRINYNYWIEATNHTFLDNLSSFSGDCLIIYGEKDRHVSLSSRYKVINKARLLNKKVIILKGENHSNWSYLQTKKAIIKTTDFLTNSLSGRP